MVKEKKEDNADTRRSKNIIEQQKEAILKCIGNICVTPEGEIIIKVDQDKDPACAKAVADGVLKGHKVRFDIERTVEVDKEEKEKD